jgi:hypothetical protein
MGHKRGERVGLFGYVSQSGRIARATEATARAESKRSVQAPVLPSLADELAKLAMLRDQGVLTDEEFEIQKQRLLAGQAAVRKPVQGRTGGIIGGLVAGSVRTPKGRRKDSRG